MAEVNFSFSQFVPCTDTPYTLCAGITCEVLAGVSYCQCKYEGVSNSSTFNFQTNYPSICQYMDSLTENTPKQVLSTYSPPIHGYPPTYGQDMGVYVCSSDRMGFNRNVAYAQCNGAICSLEENAEVGDVTPCQCATVETSVFSFWGPVEVDSDGKTKCKEQVFTDNCKSIIYNGITEDIPIGAPVGAFHYLNGMIAESSGKSKDVYDYK
eukprot:Pgem_evm1s8832